jgi:hypothetical protein
MVMEMITQLFINMASVTQITDWRTCLELEKLRRELS